MYSSGSYHPGKDTDGIDIEKAVEYILFNKFMYDESEDGDVPFDAQDRNINNDLGIDMDDSLYEDIYDGDLYHDLINGISPD